MADVASASGSHSRGASDFLWTGESEPHLTRRRAILAKYGDQVRALYGTDWTTGAQVRAALVLGVVLTIGQPVPALVFEKKLYLLLCSAFATH